MHRSTRFTGSQGPSGFGYGPLTAAVWPLRASKVIAVGLLPGHYPGHDVTRVIPNFQ